MHRACLDHVEMEGPLAFSWRTNDECAKHAKFLCCGTESTADVALRSCYYVVRAFIHENPPQTNTIGTKM